jgi:hypothetical protein
MPFVKIKALEDIIRDGLPLVKKGNTAYVEQWLADDAIEKKEAELFEPDRKPVDLKKLIELKEKQ